MNDGYSIKTERYNVPFRKIFCTSWGKIRQPFWLAIIWTYLIIENCSTGSFSFAFLSLFITLPDEPGFLLTCLPCPISLRFQHKRLLQHFSVTLSDDFSSIIHALHCSYSVYLECFPLRADGPRNEFSDDGPSLLLAIGKARNASFTEGVFTYLALFCAEFCHALYLDCFGVLWKCIALSFIIYFSVVSSCSM